MRSHTHSEYVRTIEMSALFSVPFFLLGSHSHIVGLTNAPACIALGLLVGSTASLLHPRRPMVLNPQRLRNGLFILGAAITLPFLLIEFFGNLVTLATSASDGVASGAIAAQATVSNVIPLYSDVRMHFGYWPLAAGALLQSLAWTTSRHRAIESQGKEGCLPSAHFDWPMAVAAILAGMVRLPLTITAFASTREGFIALWAISIFLSAVVASLGMKCSGSDYERVLSFYSMGALLWNGFGRIFPLSSLALRHPAIVALLGCASVIPLIYTMSLEHLHARTDQQKSDELARRTQAAGGVRKEAKPKANTSEHVEKKDVDAAAFLQACQPVRIHGYSDLTPSEKGCIDLLLVDNAQADIAKQLGKAPSTVRVLLSRAYKKLGVHSAAELYSLARAPSKPTANRQQTSDGLTVAQTNSPHTSLSILSLPAQLTLLCLLCLPTGCPAMPWGSGQVLLLALGMGFLAAGTYRIALPYEPTTPRQHRNTEILALAILGVTSIALSELESSGPLVALVGMAIPKGLFGSPLQAYESLAKLSLALPTATFGFIWGVLRRPSFVPTVANLEEHQTSLLILSPTIATVLAATMPVIRAPLALLCLIVMIVALSSDAEPLGMNAHTSHQALVKPRPGKEIDAPRETSNLGLHTAAPVLVIAMILGLVCEEAWRLLTGTSIAIATLPFCISLAIGCAHNLLSDKKVLVEIGVLAAVSLPMWIEAPEREMMCGTLAFATSTYLFVTSKRSEREQSQLSRALLLPAFGAGMLIGVVGINIYGDFLLFNKYALAFVGGAVGLTAAVSFLLGSGFAVAGAMFIAYSTRSADVAHACELGITEANPSMESRIHSLLFAHGLNETEASVVLEIARGKGISSISEELNYSHGTVNTARLNGYRKLDIHSRRQLIDFISAGTSNVNKR